MDAIAEFVAQQGGWGAWLLTVAYFVWMLSSGKLISLREHNARVLDLKERLDEAHANTEFWREAATLSTEMGNIITKAKVSLSGGRRSDESQ